MSTVPPQHDGRGASNVRRQLHQAALSAARAGRHVFPVWPGSKHPALHGKSKCEGRGICADEHQGWEQQATVDEDQIGRWWSRKPYNIGIACGPSNLVVVDLDHGHGKVAPDDSEFPGARHGAEVFERMAAKGGHDVGQTMTVATPTDGLHRLYEAPEGVALRNSASKVGWHVDVRGHGGFVVGPGSVRPEGRYEVIQPGPLAPLPEWFTERAVELTRSKTPEVSRDPLALPDGRAGQYLNKIVENEKERVYTAQSGSRQENLHVAARKLGHLVGGHELSYQDAYNALFAAAAVHIGVDDFTTREAEDTIANGIDYGARMPRHLRSIPGHSNDGPSLGVES